MSSQPRSTGRPLWLETAAIALLMTATLKIMANATISPALPALEVQCLSVLVRAALSSCPRMHALCLGGARPSLARLPPRIEAHPQPGFDCLSPMPYYLLDHPDSYYPQKKQFL